MNLSDDIPNIYYLYFDEFTGYKCQLKKLKSLINKNSIIIANDRAEIDMCNFYKLENLLVFIMHGDLDHYKSIIGEKIIDKILFVSEHLSKKYFSPFQANNVIFPTVNILNNQLQKRFLTKNKKIKIAFVGRLEFEKGADEIIKLDKLFEISWVFYIPRLNSDLSYIEDVKSKKIEFDLSNSELLNKLKDNDFLFFPSRSEGFGMAVLEAIKLGVVPIVREIEMGIMQCLTHNINSIKFTNVESLSEDLQNIQSNHEKYQELVNSGLLLVNDKFDSIKICRNFTSEIRLLRKKHKEFGSFQRDSSFFMPIWIFRILKKTW